MYDVTQVYERHRITIFELIEFYLSKLSYSIAYINPKEYLLYGVSYEDLLIAISSETIKFCFFFFRLTWSSATNIHILINHLYVLVKKKKKTLYFIIFDTFRKMAIYRV